MKRLFVLFITSVLLLSMIVSLTACTDKATDFPTSTIENGYYNYIVGGNIASVNDSLYLNVKGGSLYLGTYKKNSEGTTKLFTEDLDVDYSVNSPSMYQVGDSIYFTDAEYSEFRVFNCEKDLLTDDKFDINSGNGICYISDDLNIYFADDVEHLKYRFKDNKEVTLDESATAFAVYDNKIYFITPKGELYYNDPSELKSECVFLSQLNDNGILSKMLICNGYCYFTDNGRSDTKEGVYRYSLEKDTVELSLEEEILSMNMQGDKVYFATDKGVYVDNAVECKKLTSQKATELYVFDDEWIYLYNQEKGLTHRVSSDGTQTQVID